MSQDKDRLTQTDPLVEIHLDAGVFNWLHDMIEAKHAQRTYRDWLPWYDKLVERAFEQFNMVNQELVEPVAVPVRKVRNRRSDPVSSTTKRVIRRRG